MSVKKIAKYVAAVIMCAIMPIVSCNAAADITALRSEMLVRLGLMQKLNPSRQVTREEAIKTVVTILGMGKEAEQANNQSTFTDVSDEASAYVAYAASNGIINSSGTLLSATSPSTLKELCTFYLRGLGYGFDIYDTALETATTLNLIPQANDSVLTAKELVNVSYNILFAKAIGESTLTIRRLVDTGVISEYTLSNSGDDGLIAAYLSSTGVTASRSVAGVKGDMSEAASIVFPNQIKKFNIVTTGADTIKEGVECVQIETGARIALSIDREYITPQHQYCTAIVTYFDQGVDKIRVSYSDKVLEYANAYIQKTNTLTWKSQPIVIRNAAFSQKQENGSDLTVWAEDESGIGTIEYISQITLVRQTQEEQPPIDTGEQAMPAVAYIDLEAVSNSLLINQFLLSDPNWYGYTTPTEIGGEQCVQVGVNKRVVLFLDDDFMDPADGRCRITITYFDQGSNRMRFAYSTESERYKTIYINKSDSGTWKTFTIEVDDASFMNRQDGGVDFTIWGVNTNDSETGEELEYIKRVEIERLQ